MTRERPIWPGGGSSKRATSRPGCVREGLAAVQGSKFTEEGNRHEATGNSRTLNHIFQPFNRRARLTAVQSSRACPESVEGFNSSRGQATTLNPGSDPANFAHGYWRALASFTISARASL